MSYRFLTDPPDFLVANIFAQNSEKVKTLRNEDFSKTPIFGLIKTQMPERIISPESIPPQPPSPERIPNPESFAAGRKEQPAPPAEQKQETTLPSLPHHVAPPKPPLDALQREVETILAEGLDDAYAAMDPLSKQEFKEEGEKAAVEIRSLLDEARVKIHKLLKILTSWLRMIPGVSRLFVEQEAKIKTDRLLSLRRKKFSDTEHPSQ